MPNGVQFNDFVGMDNNLLTSLELSSSDIVRVVHGECEQDGDTDNESDDSPIPPPPPSSSDARECLRILQRYFETKDAVKAEESLHLLSKLERTLCTGHLCAVYRLGLLMIIMHNRTVTNCL